MYRFIHRYRREIDISAPEKSQTNLKGTIKPESGNKVSSLDSQKRGNQRAIVSDLKENSIRHHCGEIDIKAPDFKPSRATRINSYKEPSDDRLKKEVSSRHSRRKYSDAKNSISSSKSNTPITENESTISEGNFASLSFTGANFSLSELDAITNETDNSSQEYNELSSEKETAANSVTSSSEQLKINKKDSKDSIEDSKGVRGEYAKKNGRYYLKQISYNFNLIPKKDPILAKHFHQGVRIGDLCENNIENLYTLIGIGALRVNNKSKWKKLLEAIKKNKYERIETLLRQAVIKDSSYKGQLIIDKKKREDSSDITRKMFVYFNEI